MKITLVCTFLGEPNNGTSLVAYNLIDALKEKGHEVRVVCCDENKIGIPGYYICKKLKFEPILNAALKRNCVTPAKLTNKILEEACDGVDYVHTFSPLFSAGKVLKYCLKHNIPFGAGFHCQAENFTAHFKTMNCPFWNWMIYKIFFHNVYNKATVIHYPTQFIKDYVHKYDKNNIPSYVISNGVDTTMFSPAKTEKDPIFNNKFLIVMSGRICHEKNQKSLLKAIKYSKHKDEIFIRFAGKGPDTHKVLRKIKKWNIAADVKAYTHEDLNSILRQADLYVHTSRVEIEAISALEAMSCGVVPIICNSKKSATSAFALSDFNKYQQGKYKQLAQKIDYWFEHPELKEEWSIKYSDFVKQFEKTDCMNKMNDMIVQTVEKYAEQK